jgi:hypothetical protein
MQRLEMVMTARDTAANRRWLFLVLAAIALVAIVSAFGVYGHQHQHLSPAAIAYDHRGGVNH